MQEKSKGKLFFPTFVFDSKTRSQFSHAKNQREISNDKVKRLLWPFGGGKCGNGGELYRKSWKCII